jgi:putative ABC transport system substrate-binding protein
LELLLEIVPGLSRGALLLLKDSVGRSDALKRYQEAARVLKLDLHAIDLRSDSPDLSTTFDATIKARVNAMIPTRNRTLNRLVPRIAELALKNRLPTMFERIGAVENGGLASYTADELEGYRRAAVYVDKILKGAKPADLSVKQPTKFELVINLKTAKQIGLTIPPNVLARADRVIR